MISKIATFALAATCSLSALAVDVKMTGPVWDSSQENPSEGPFVVRYAQSSTTPLGTTAFGQLKGSYLPGGPSFQAYCVEIDVNLPLNTPVQYSLGSFSTQTARDLGKLLTWAQGSLPFIAVPSNNVEYYQNAARSAAIQAAVYEIIYDGLSSSSSFGTGNLRALQADQSNLKVKAALNAVNWNAINAISTPAFVVSKLDGGLNNPSAQDLMIFAPVPETSTLAMMMLGLTGVCAVARKRLSSG